MFGKISKKYSMYIYMYVFSCFAILLCAHFSPVYQYNFSGDPSVYLTIGRGLVNGEIPYKDLLDIKGPVIFFLYAIFSPIKLGTNYFGIFILETISLWISITFVYKTILLISKSSKYSFILTLFYPFFLLNKDSFMNGGEAEEFILPFLNILLYMTLIIIKNDYFATRFQYLFLGFSVGYVFWIKYTCLGAWIAFYLGVSFILLSQKKLQELKKLIIFSLLGFLIPTIIIGGYFIFNHAITDLIWGYFGWNYFYGGSTHESILKQLFFIIFHSFTIFLKRNPIIWIFVIIGPYLSIISSKIVKKNSAKIILFLMTFCSIGLEFIGGIMYQYYQLMSIPFVVLTFCWIAIKLKNINNINNINNILFIILISFFILTNILIVNPSVKQSKLTGYVPYQERFANKIYRDGKTFSILDFNEVDHGWYNYLNKMPNTKFFNKMNLHYYGEYKPYIKAQLNIIKEKKVTYVICPVSKYSSYNNINKIVLKNYKIIDSQEVNDFNTIKFLLLKRK